MTENSKMVVSEQAKEYFIAGLSFEPKIVDSDGFLIDIKSEKMLDYVESSLAYSKLTLLDTFNNSDLVINTITILCSLPFNSRFIKKSTIDNLIYVDTTMKLYRLRDVLIGLKLPMYNIASESSTVTHGKYIIINTNVTLYNEIFNIAGVDNTIHAINPNLKEDAMSINLTKDTRKSKTLAIENALLNLGIGLYLY